jgi:hypothetical protein
VIEGNLVTAVHFTSLAIYTVSRAALVKVWQRPPKQTPTTKRANKPVMYKNEGLRSPRERDIAVAG